MPKHVEPSKRKRVLIVDPWLSQPIWTGAGSYFRKVGRYHLDLHNDPRIPTCEAIARSNYDGVICAAPNEVRELLRPLQRPVVFTLGLAPDWRQPTVVLDDEAIGRVGAEYLLQQGYRRFGFYGVGLTWSQARAKGFTAAIAAHTLECLTTSSSGLDMPDWDQIGDEAFAGNWVSQLKPPAAVMACDDTLARVLANACIAHGLRIPRDIAILGVDNIEPLCEVADPPLSSIDTNVEHVGYEAAALLERMIQGQDVGACTITVKPRGVIARQSTSLMAYDDPEVAAAMRFIREHACEEVDVDALCKNNAISRRQLERRFIKVVGHTPFEEIRYQRMEKAKQLLTQTHLSVLQIALRCGYDNDCSFATMFRRRIGCTPMAYRKQFPA